MYRNGSFALIFFKNKLNCEHVAFLFLFYYYISSLFSLFSSLEILRSRTANFFFNDHIVKRNELLLFSRFFSLIFNGH